MRLLSLILPAFAASAAVPPTALVFGHKIPDTDAICAALAYTWELNERGIPAEPRRLGNLGLGSSQADDSRMKYRNILGHGLHPVALGVNRDEQRLYQSRVRPESLHDPGELREGRRAYIRTVGESEKDQ